jgi:hypothetical protein
VRTCGVWSPKPEDLEALLTKLRVLTPELLEANGVLPPGGDDVPFRLIARDRTHPHAA